MKHSRSLRLAVLATLALSASCEPDLGEQPFLCGADGSCPDGYSCRATICEKDGSTQQVFRPLRTTWINAAEMYWFPSKGGGASLVVNDGFTQGARAMYEIHVDPSGAVATPKLLLDLREDFPTSTAVVALDDDNYAIVALRFPSVDEDAQELTVYKVPRDLAEGDEATATVLYTTNVPFLGGAEPAYIGAVAGGSGLDVCFVDPSEGGTLHVRRIAGGEPTRDLTLPLTSDVLPLSGDCILWPVGEDLAVRVGLEIPLFYRIPDAAATTADIEGPIPTAGLAVYPFADRIVSLVLDPLEDNEDFSSASLVSTDWTGDVVSTDDLGTYPTQLEPHTAWGAASQVLFAPASSADSFSDLQVFTLDDNGVSKVATVTRPGDDTLYSARAIAVDGTVYLGWTATHADLMDLWIGTAKESQ
ncbi:MAG: hypothetical protein HOW73_04755 [Polyangiaceae bacterium]|nr:hypothetical protein [Polyangiaceae bacterium]